MKAILKFNLPEEKDLFKDYQDGVKCKWILQGLTQNWKRAIEMDNPTITPERMLKELYDELDDEGVSLFL